MAWRQAACDGRSVTAVVRFFMVHSHRNARLQHSARAVRRQPSGHALRLCPGPRSPTCASAARSWSGSSTASLPGRLAIRETHFACRRVLHDPLQRPAGSVCPFQVGSAAPDPVPLMFRAVMPRNIPVRVAAARGGHPVAVSASQGVAAAARWRCLAAVLACQGLGQPLGQPRGVVGAAPNPQIQRPRGSCCSCGSKTY